MEDDLPLADGIPDEDPFVTPVLVHDHLIIGHPDGEHVAPILDAVPLVVLPLEAWPFDDSFDDDVDLFVEGPPVDAQGDGEIDKDVVAVSTSCCSYSFESVTPSALQMAGLQLFATDSDDDTTMSATLSPARDPTPPHDPELAPELAPVPFGSA
ncbi:hypothetical protein Hanom_Chr04g00335151 [Helianthus anomalus]